MGIFSFVLMIWQVIILNILMIKKLKGKLKNNYKTANKLILIIFIK